MHTITPAETIIPSWTDGLLRLDDTSHDLTFYGAGWPMRALWYVEEYASQPALSRGRGGIALPSRATGIAASGREHLRALPLRPIWSGLAADSFFYALVLAVPCLAPTPLRRFLRIRRGLCPACGYPAGSSAICSECGNAIAVRYGGLSPAVECSAPGSGAGACGIGAGAAASGTSTE